MTEKPQSFLKPSTAGWTTISSFPFHQWELTAAVWRTTPAKRMSVSDHSSSALWQHPLRAVESPEASTPSPPTRYLQLNPVCPRLPGLKWRGLSGSPPLPPTFKNISWTISMCPHPGQLLLLTNYRLGNPVTHWGLGSFGYRWGFQGTAARPRANHS